jgi:small-conductance mechanosensitive channel
MEKIFIEQAKHIRIEYIKVYKNMNECESKIEVYKNQLIDIKKEIDNVDNENDFKEKLIIIEKNIKNIETILKPHLDKIKNLEKSADTLFENIKERYPNISKEEIQNELIPHLMEIKF